MKGRGFTGGWLRRAAIANALVWLLVLQSLLSVAGNMRAYGAQLNDGPFFAVLCTSPAGIERDDDGQPSEPVRAAFHCILCPPAQGGAGPVILAAPAPDLPAPVLLRRIAASRPLCEAKPSSVGEAFAWSSRAPPFNA